MLNLIYRIPGILSNYLKKFKDIFTRRIQYKNFSTYCNGLLLELKRTSIQAIDSCRLRDNYQSLHHFIKNSPWDEEKINTRRVEIMEQDKRTCSKAGGALIIDDTSNKKSGKNTEGAKVQYCGTEGGLARCNVVVTSHYADEKKDFGINIEPYLPEDEYEWYEKEEFVPKGRLAEKLVMDALDKGINFGDVLIDNWYLSKSFVGSVESKGKVWISTLDKGRVIYRRGKKMTTKELVAQTPAHAYQQAVKVYKNGEEKRYYIYGVDIKISGFRGKKRAVIAKPDIYTTDMDKIDVYVTNDIRAKDIEIVQRYQPRWRIEDHYRDIKDNLSFDQYQVRDIRSIKRHWYLSILVHTFLVFSRMKGSFRHFIEVKARTIGELIRSFWRINMREFLKWITRGKRKIELLWEYLRWKGVILGSKQ